MSQCVFTGTNVAFIVPVPKQDLSEPLGPVSGIRADYGDFARELCP